ATATGLNATAVGPGTSATFANSSAIGTGATATAPNQMAFGTASNTYVAPGITSAGSKAAQSGPLEIVTSDAGGHLATHTAAGVGAGIFDGYKRDKYEDGRYHPPPQ